MKEARNNIFMNIVKTEDQTTELLRNYMQFRVFRDAILGRFFKKQDVIASINNEHLYTQMPLGEYGRPDLVIKNNRIIMLFEIKTNNAELTENQPSGYLNYLDSLENDVAKWLVFIVPRDYKHRHLLDHRIQTCKASLARMDVNALVLCWTDVLRKERGQTWKLETNRNTQARPHLG